MQKIFKNIKEWDDYYYGKFKTFKGSAALYRKLDNKLLFNNKRCSKIFLKILHIKYSNITLRRLHNLPDILEVDDESVI